MFHGEVADGRQPDLVGRGGERPHRPRTAFGSGEDSHHMGAPLDLLVQAFEHVGALHMLVCAGANRLVGSVSLRYLGRAALAIGQLYGERLAPPFPIHHNACSISGFGHRSAWRSNASRTRTPADGRGLAM